MPTETDLAVKYLKDFEGLKLQAYQCSAGKWTVGYGATGPQVVEGTTWTTDQATQDLTRRVRVLCLDVKNIVSVPLTGPQLAALVSLTYNIGWSAFARSTLLKLLNRGDYQGAADSFLVWNKVTVNGEKRAIGGLVTRRARERDLFLSGCTGVTS